MSEPGQRAADATAASPPGHARVLRPEGWPRPSGYSNGMAARGTHIHVAGQVGWDPVTHEFASDDIAEQAGRALANVIAVLAAGGAGAEHVVRMTWYVTDLAAYAVARAAIGRAFRSLFGDNYPAMSLVEVAGLLEPRALVEIDATAIAP